MLDDCVYEKWFLLTHKNPNGKMSAFEAKKQQINFTIYQDIVVKAWNELKIPLKNHGCCLMHSKHGRRTHGKNIAVDFGSHIVFGRKILKYWNPFPFDDSRCLH